MTANLNIYGKALALTRSMRTPALSLLATSPATRCDDSHHGHHDDEHHGHDGDRHATTVRASCAMPPSTKGRPVCWAR
jgi:hypothetical protein